jgi:hypothetical protein
VLLLCIVLQGWATAGFLPGHQWWSSYWAASTPQLLQHKPQELATSLWAAAQLQQHPPAAWLAGFWAASGAAMPYASPQELCMMLWGVVTLQLRPGNSWWAVLQAAAADRAQQMGPRDVAQVSHVSVWGDVHEAVTGGGSCRQQVRHVCGVLRAWRVCEQRYFCVEFTSSGS